MKNIKNIIKRCDVCKKKKKMDRASKIWIITKGKIYWKGPVH